MFSQKSVRKQSFISVSFAVAASVLAVAVFVYAATTIGTNISVDGNLTVSGTSATSTFSTGGLTVGTNQFVVQQTSGNVGIGTTSPGGRFTIRSIGADAIRIDPAAETAAPLYGGDIRWFDNNGVLKFLIRPDISGNGVGSLGFEDRVASGAPFRLQLLPNGDVGLGGSMLGQGSLGGATLVALGGGNVGIGTTSPVQLLSIAGDTYIAGTGTTTLNLKTTTASKGTCIEMFDSGGAVRRLYINAAGAITVEAGTCK